MDTVTTSLAGEWIERRNRAVPRGLATYANSVVVDRAHGAEVWDVEGRRYIDFAGGIGTLNAGHTPDAVVNAIRGQAEKLIHMCFSVAYYPGYIELAERLCDLMPGHFEKKALLLNSGAEAIENAVKFARAATGRTGVISFENGFHGRTMMALSLTGKERPYKAGFGPFAPDVYHARFPYRYRCECAAEPGACVVENGADLERIFATEVAPESVAAIVVEPVQGEGGFVVAPPGWLRLLREVCDRHGILLIADEVQTGFGRTGKMLAVEHSGIQPDLVVVAKSLAGGLPLSAVIGKSEIMDAPEPGGVGGTYAGNPIACAAALAVLDLFKHEGLVERGRRVGEIVSARFNSMKDRYDLIGDVRGLGAMQAIELVLDRVDKIPAPEHTSAIMHECHDHGLIVIKAGLYDNVIRILAPLTIGDDLLNEGLDILEESVSTTR
jgi:4-aminobutyrate aminotransferase/(S)-3-amino-2-methylpropionate transaminase